MSQFMKNALLWMAFVGMTFFAFQSVYDGPPKENMTYSEFISLAVSYTHLTLPTKRIV